MILKDIKEKLQEVDSNVFYGMVKRKMRESLWNYIVYDRRIMKPTENKTGYTYYFRVHIVREEWIPEGLDIEVINKMLEIKGMKLASNDMQYTYATKGNTDTVVEMLTIEFCRAVKV